MKTSRALLFALLTGNKVIDRLSTPHNISVFLYNATYATRMNQRDSKQIEMEPNVIYFFGHHSKSLISYRSCKIANLSEILLFK